jgi:hypothetical protein
MGEHEAYRPLTEYEKNIHLFLTEKFPGMWGHQGILGSGEANFYDNRQTPMFGGVSYPINAYYPARDTTLGVDDTMYPPAVLESGLLGVGTDIERFFRATGIVLTYPTALSGERLLKNGPGELNPSTSGIAASILAPDNLSFYDADLSNSSATLDNVIDLGLYDFDIFNSYIHYYGKTPGDPMPKWQDLFPSTPASLENNDDAIRVSYQKVYPSIAPFRVYENREPYNATQEEIDCGDQGGDWVGGVCVLP